MHNYMYGKCRHKNELKNTCFPAWEGKSLLVLGVHELFVFFFKSNKRKNSLVNLDVFSLCVLWHLRSKLTVI